MLEARQIFTGLAVFCGVLLVASASIAHGRQMDHLAAYQSGAFEAHLTLSDLVDEAGQIQARDCFENQDTNGVLVAHNTYLDSFEAGEDAMWMCYLELPFSAASDESVP